MLRSIALLLFAVGAGYATEPKPILAIVERNPWLAVIGSDSPAFALYDDGTMVYRREKPSPEEPFYRRSVDSAADTAKALLGFDPAQMKDHYVLSDATDQLETTIWTPSKAIYVYGYWRSPPTIRPNGDAHYTEASKREMDLWESLPPEIQRALHRIDQERRVQGTRWLPPKIEVMFWPYENASDPSIAWPEAWPALSAPDTLKRGNSFSVFLPSEKFSDLQAFAATQKEKGAVLIEGRKMAAAIRFPFPGESAWMR